MNICERIKYIIFFWQTHIYTTFDRILVLDYVWAINWNNYIRQNIKHNDGRDNPYEDPVDMKLLSTFKTSFIPENFSTDANSQSHANAAQVQNETFISINQQRPGSLSDSGEFPKPPDW